MTVICHQCKTHSVVSIVAKCDDRCQVEYNDKQIHGYVPREIGIGGGDYIRISYCHICMRIQSETIPLETIKEVFEEEDEN